MYIAPLSHAALVNLLKHNMQQRQEGPESIAKKGKVRLDEIQRVLEGKEACRLHVITAFGKVLRVDFSLAFASYTVWLYRTEISKPSLIQAKQWPASGRLDVGAMKEIARAIAYGNPSADEKHLAADIMSVTHLSESDAKAIIRATRASMASLDAEAAYA